MSFLESLKRKAIDDGKLFILKNKKTQFETPKDQCGFKMTLLPIHSMVCRAEVDPYAVVSLALVNQRSSMLDSYANKLPIMAINVLRLLYTVETFTLKNQNTNYISPEQQALEFYVQTDLKYRDSKLPPNEQFSEFLHRLRSCGYRDYIFELARETNANIDYIFDSKVAARYIKIANDSNKIYSTSIGFITAIHEPNNEWYVKTTKTPIITGGLDIL